MVRFPDKENKLPDKVAAFGQCRDGIGCLAEAVMLKG